MQNHQLKTLNCSIHHIPYEETSVLHARDCTICEYAEGFFLSVPQENDAAELFNTAEDFKKYCTSKGYSKPLTNVLALADLHLCQLVWLHSEGDYLSQYLQNYDW